MVGVSAQRSEHLEAITLPAPRAPLEALLAGPTAPLAAWEGRDGHVLVGLGAAAAIRGADPASAAAVYARIRGPAPPFVGGLAFAAGPSGRTDAIWSGFGDGLFVLPRWTYRVIDGAATLTFVGEALPHHELEAIRDRLARPTPATLPPAAHVDEDDGAPFRAAVSAALGEIAAARLDKVVLARRLRVDADGPFADRTVLTRLAGPGVTRFALRVDGATFLGASPERLVGKRGRAVTTEALAGSAPTGRAAALVASAKDRHEHRPVVEAIAAALAPLCDALDVPEAPEPRLLRDVVHLATEIRGRLAADAHVLDLVAALHPTPAVGGKPRAAALAFIAAHEPPRGWYAAPFGWFDRDGDGEFAVALRSGVVRGAHAHVYAGSGIVAGSDPDAELAETRLKLRTMLVALGAEG
jgi:isochorismate synthase